MKVLRRSFAEVSVVLVLLASGHAYAQSAGVTPVLPVVASTPQSLASLLDQAKMMAEQGRFDEAKQLLQQAMSAVDALKASAAVPASVPERIQVSAGDIGQPRVLSKPKPIYPAAAIAAKVQGNVYISMVIGTDGAVKEANVTAGPAMLREAALTAVRQWRYMPILFGGKPVEVATTVTVTFLLGGR